MNNRNVAHLWASRNREHGKGSNFYFDGPTIYSYGGHFPIAKFTDKADENGDTVVLFNCAGYSMSTNRHKSYTRQALHGLPVRIFEVPEVAAHGYAHDRNMAHFRAEYESEILKASRSRKYVATHVANAERMAGDACDYARAFGLDVPQFEEVSPELLATAKQRAQAEADAQRAKIEADKAARENEFVSMAEAWRNGATSHECELWRFQDFPTLLRVKGDAIETSRGAVVPLAVARNLWRLVMAARSGTLPEIPARSMVGDYQLRQVTRDGSLVIGCHTLEYPELERMAVALGFLIP